jgi:Lrp/AsnC family transcriptional regulator, leucine-responsive regulatory protein
MLACGLTIGIVGNIPIGMDNTDRKIIDALQADARTTQAAIARNVGLSQPSVADRIRKLEEAGVIKGYVARIDHVKLGLDVTAFIGIHIEHPRHFDRFAEVVKEMDEVLECHRVAGEESYVLKVRAENTAALDRLLVECLRTIPGVTRTNTTIVLASVKEETRTPRAGGGVR